MPVQPRPQAFSWGVNGKVYAVAIVGDRIFVGGDFSSAVSTTGQTLTRHNLAGFSMVTGRPLRTWVAGTSGPVFALASSSRGLWVGGNFDAIDGVERHHVAKVSVDTGTVDPDFDLSTSGTVRALDVAGARLFAGGDFLYAGASAGPERHEHVLAADAATGAIDSAFQTTVSSTVRSLDASGGRLYLGGRFAEINGQARPGLGSVNASTGRLAGPLLESAKSPTLAVRASPDGRLLVAGIGGSPRAVPRGNTARGWDARTGQLLWQVALRGDAQAVAIRGGVAFVGFHGGYSRYRKTRLLAIRGHSGKVISSFEPAFGTSRWGVLALDVTSQGLAAGGDFARVAGRPQRNVTTFGARR